LLGICYIGANAQRVPAGLLNLDVRQIDLGLAAADEGNPGAQARKSKRQALSDSPACARDKYVLVPEFARRNSAAHVLSPDCRKPVPTKE
jgi:hypothetical protein